MKTKLIVIGMAMILGGWIVAAPSRCPERKPKKDLEQRVEELEQIVQTQAQTIAAQQEQLNYHQQEIERSKQVTDEMELITWNDGSKTIDVRTANLVLDFGNLQAMNLLAAWNIYLFGDIIDYGFTGQ